MAQAEARLFSSINRGADLGAAAEQQLWLGLLAFFTFVDEHRDSWNVLFGEATAGSGPFVPEAVRVRQRIARQVSQLLRTAAAAEGVTARRLMATEPLANALIGSAESLANWWIDKGEESKETVATWLMNFAWLGFGDLVQGQAWLPEGQAGKRKRRAGTG